METKVYFNHIVFEIIRRIERASYSVRVAVAWFTNPELYSAIRDAVERGVRVELILMADKINLESKLDWEKLKQSGAGIFWYDISDSSLMHHKFCIIDDEISLTGSFNWTLQASYKNYENLTVIIDAQTAKDFTKEFLYLRDRLSFENIKIAHSNKVMYPESYNYLVRIDVDEDQIFLIHTDYNAENELETRKVYPDLDDLNKALQRLCFHGTYKMSEQKHEKSEEEIRDFYDNLSDDDLLDMAHGGNSWNVSIDPETGESYSAADPRYDYSYGLELTGEFVVLSKFDFDNISNDKIIRCANDDNFLEFFDDLDSEKLANHYLLFCEEDFRFLFEI